MDYKKYTVQKHSKQRLLDFILNSLVECGCKILKASCPSIAPFCITFEDVNGIRQGILVYAFTANSELTKNRPSNEHRMQIKYGKKPDDLQRIWQDPYQLYTTLMVGIDLDRGIFVGVDPLMHEWTKFFISIEFKRHQVEEILDKGWHYWERDKRNGSDTPVEVMVGGVSSCWLKYVQFEQAARGLDQGHRYLLAENIDRYGVGIIIGNRPEITPLISEQKVHQLANEFEINEDEILNMIQAAPMLKMAVRGWVAEKHLEKLIRDTSGVDEVIQLEEAGRPDFEVIYKGSPKILIECKNVLRVPLANGTTKVDFQKTRASKEDPCSRFYSSADFHILAACLHARTESWDFSFKNTAEMSPHKNCPGKLSNLVRIDDDTWKNDLAHILDGYVA